MQPCRTCTKIDCHYSEWQPWSACDSGSGQQQRFRHIVNQASCEGKACAPKQTEQMTNCSRHAHGPTYCTWDAWGPWEQCTASCGTQAVKGRVRTLKRVHGQVEPQIVRDGNEGELDLQSKYQELSRRAGHQETRRTQELAIAFLCGCFALLSGFLVSSRMQWRADHGQYSDIREAQVSPLEVA